MGVFIQEHSQLHPQIRAVCAAGHNHLAGDFRQALEAAKANYAPRGSLGTAERGEATDSRRAGRGRSGQGQVGYVGGRGEPWAFQGPPQAFLQCSRVGRVILVNRCR
jgi:hypothetical protein